MPFFPHFAVSRARGEERKSTKLIRFSADPDSRFRPGGLEKTVKVKGPAGHGERAEKIERSNERSEKFSDPVRPRRAEAADCIVQQLCGEKQCATSSAIRCNKIEEDYFRNY